MGTQSGIIYEYTRARGSPERGRIYEFPFFHRLFYRAEFARYRDIDVIISIRTKFTIGHLFVTVNSVCASRWIATGYTRIELRNSGVNILLSTTRYVIKIRSTVRVMRSDRKSGARTTTCRRLWKKRVWSGRRAKFQSTTEIAREKKFFFCTYNQSHFRRISVVGGQPKKKKKIRNSKLFGKRVPEIRSRRKSARRRLWFPSKYHRVDWYVIPTYVNESWFLNFPTYCSRLKKKKRYEIFNDAHTRISLNWFFCFLESRGISVLRRRCVRYNITKILFSRQTVFRDARSRRTIT